MTERNGAQLGNDKLISNSGHPEYLDPNLVKMPKLLVPQCFPTKHKMFKLLKLRLTSSHFTITLHLKSHQCPFCYFQYWLETRQPKPGMGKLRPGDQMQPSALYHVANSWFKEMKVLVSQSHTYKYISL